MVRHKALMAGHLYHNYVSRLPSRDFLEAVDAESGAAGANRAWVESRDGYPDVRRQELGELLVSEGLTLGLPGKMRLGIRALSFGMGLQADDGPFPGPKEGRPSHAGTAFFVCSACSGLMMLANSNHPKGKELAAEWRPRLVAAAGWLAEAAPDHPELSNHICGAAGAAAAVSAIYPDAGVGPAARQLCDAACELQRPDGSWPERGGGDSLYQAISLIYMTYALLTCEPGETRDGLGAAIERGFAWLSDRIGEDGSLDCTGNPRKRWDRRPDDNESILASDFVAVTYALRLRADTTGDAKWASLAARVLEWIARAKPGGERNVWEATMCGRR